MSCTRVAHLSNLAHATHDFEEFHQNQFEYKLRLLDWYIVNWSKIIDGKLISNQTRPTFVLGALLVADDGMRN